MKTISSKVYFLISVFVAGLLISTGFLTLKSKMSDFDETKIDINENSKTNKISTTGSIQLKPSDSESSPLVGTEYGVKIIASSEKRNIVGYDYILKFDRDVFDLVDFVSPLENFKVFTFDNDDGITVTGVKDVNDDSETIFAGTVIAEFDLLPKSEGDHIISLETTRGKEKTQMVDDKTISLNPQINQLTISVGD